MDSRRGVRHGASRRTRFRNPMDFTWISDFRLNFCISRGFLDFKVDFCIIFKVDLDLPGIWCIKYMHEQINGV